MKKWCKRISILLLLGVLVFALCGCAELDRMRELQIFVEEDGSFYHKGVHYVELDANDYFYPAGLYSRIFYLTEPDVPVLLSSDYASGRLAFTEDGLYCRDYSWGRWFCAEDVFEETQAKNRDPYLPDTLYYEYYEYKGNGVDEHNLYVLSAKEYDAINKVLEGDPLELGDGMYLSYDWGMGLTASTKDLLFRHEGPDIQKAGETYYLVIYRENGPITYKVPEEYKEIFDGMLENYAKTYYYY